MKTLLLQEFISFRTVREVSSLMLKQNSFWISLVVESKAIWESCMIHWHDQGNKQDGEGVICKIESSIEINPKEKEIVLCLEF